MFFFYFFALPPRGSPPIAALYGGSCLGGVAVRLRRPPAAELVLRFAQFGASITMRGPGAFGPLFFFLLRPGGTSAPVHCRVVVYCVFFWLKRGPASGA